MHFLDSDDWLDLDCIAQCVEVALAQDAQIVFHWRKIFNDLNGKFESEKSLSEGWGLMDGGLYSGLEVFKNLPSLSFSWAWLGMVRLGFLTSHGLRFERGIESEDALFGMQLFALASRIVVLDRGLIYYRLRANSISQFTLSEEDRYKTKSLDSFSSSQRDIAEAFGGNAYLVRHYSFCHSCAVISLRMDEFLQLHQEIFSGELIVWLRKMIAHRVNTAFRGCAFGKDPRGCREICAKLRSYPVKIDLNVKLAYHFPSIFRILKMLKNRFFI